MSRENCKILKILFSDDEITFIKSDTTTSLAPLNSEGIKLELRVSTIFHKALNKTRVEGIFEKNDFEFLGNILFRILCLENQKEARDFIYNELSYILRDKSTRGLIILEFMPEVAHLAVLPWEYLQIKQNPDKKIEPFYLGARKDEKFDLIRFVRHNPQEAGKDYSTPDNKKLVVLSIISSPKARFITRVEKKKLEDSFAALEDEFNKDEQNPVFEWWRIEDPNTETFLDDLKNVVKQIQTPYIIHFYGHARMDKNGPALAFVDARSGEEDWVPCSEFQEYFGPEQTYKQPVAFVMQACESGQINVNGEGFGISLIKKDIPFVVAMQNEVTPDTSVAFFDKFYRSLLSGYDIFRAVTSGRAFLGCTYGKRNPDVDHDHYNDNSFGTPVLFSSTTQPVRFLPRLEPVESDTSPPKLVCSDCKHVYDYRPEHVGIRCFKGRCRGTLELQESAAASANLTREYDFEERSDAHR